MLNFDAVRKIGLSLDEVVEGTAYGAPALKLRGRLLACVPTNKSAEVNSMVVRIDLGRRAQLLRQHPEFYYVTDHYAPHPTVLVRLSKITRTELKQLLSEAWNFASAKPSKPAARARGMSKRDAANSMLLSGGNPRVPKGDGDGPVQAYIAAMPGWKRDIGRRLDAIIARTLPAVRKAVKWNSPFYGIEGQGWFLGFHCMTKYVKVAFFRGTSLRPLPPGESKQEEVRYLNIYELDEFDEDQLTGWVKQASRLPGKLL